MGDEASKMLEESQQKKIELIDDFLHQFEGLCMTESFSDVVFIVKTERIYAHRAILATRSEYFRGMLFSGLAETHQREVELDVGLQPFKELLKFFYTGSIFLSKDADKFGSVLDIFELAHFYDLKDLVSEIYDFLTESLGVDNACCILNFAVLHKLDDLREDCLVFLEKTTEEFIKHKSFKTLSKESLEVLLESKSFCPPEVDIFRAVVDWHKNNLKVEIESIFSKICLSKMQVDEIVRVVQPTGLISEHIMFTALCKSVLSKSLPYSATQASDFVKGTNQPVKFCSALFNGVHLELMDEALLNHVRFTILQHAAAFHYVVEVSLDSWQWERVIDYREYWCSSMQCIYFEARKFRYIKIFSDEKIELQVHGVFHVEDVPNMVADVVAPTYDVFTSQKELQLGVSSSIGLELTEDGYYTETIEFSQPINISSIRLFDVDHKARFWIKTSIDDETWSYVYFGEFEEPRILLDCTFEPRVVTYIRIFAKSADGEISKMSLECPAQSI